MIRALTITFALVLAMSAAASDLALPTGAKLLSERPSTLARYALPLGPVAEDVVPVRQFEGQVLRRTWRLGGDATSLQVFAPIRQQIETQGYDIQYQCQAEECGGFNFRFDIEVVPAPDMMVNIGDFQFLSAVQNDVRAISLLVSRSGLSTYIQVIEVAPPDAELLGVGPTEIVSDVVVPDQDAQEDAGDLIRALTSRGRVVLDDLEFETGSSRLGEGPFGSLAQLAAALAETAEMRILLVGHTDNIGTQSNNVALSQKRAEAVRDRILERFEISATRIEVGGAGYMAPLTSNQTPEGRETNRRVEAVLLSN